MPAQHNADATLPWTMIDPIGWLKSLQSGMRLAPHAVDQAINPGWSFGPVVNITPGNSSAPETELEILQQHSYGRQLGRIADALSAVLEARGGNALSDPRIAAFKDMKAEIDRLKLHAAESRLSRWQADLEVLKKARPVEFEKLKRELRKTLES